MPTPYFYDKQNVSSWFNQMNSTFYTAHYVGHSLYTHHFSPPLQQLACAMQLRCAVAWETVGQMHSWHKWWWKAEARKLSKCMWVNVKWQGREWKSVIVAANTTNKKVREGVGWSIGIPSETFPFGLTRSTCWSDLPMCSWPLGRSEALR